MPAERIPDLLRPLAYGWMGKIDIAIKHKRQHFQEIADQCMGFFSGSVGFMYDPKFQQRFIGGSFSPKFRITLNKAFELVALFGPLICNQIPTREADQIDAIEYGPEIFGDANDPQVQQAYQQAIEREKQQRGIIKSGCQALERYLNYTPGEQPNGGLLTASQDACTEALIKGRGLLWQEPFTMPGSNRVLTGSFYDTVDRLLIDPDAESANFGEAYWIAKECIEPHWKVERDRGLPPNSLRGKGNLESAESQGAQGGNRRANRERALGNTFDLVRYWKIWSIGGVGTRLSGMNQFMQSAFDDVVGDYAYIEVARGIPYPLNMPIDKFAGNPAAGRLGASDEDVKRAFSWPVPYWLKRRWPVVMLDFYRQPNCSWPISPLRPGLGELVALNIIMSHLTNHIWQNSRTLIAVLKSAQKEVQVALDGGGDNVVVGIPEILKDIDHLIKFIQGPGVNYDVWKIVDHLFSLFDKRVGFNELLYGLNPGAASRTKDDAQTKQQQIYIRPDQMSRKFEEFQSEAANNEKLCAFFSGVDGESVKPVLGEIGAQIFDRTFTNANPEVVIHQMNCTITSGSAKRPNRDRDAANIKEIYQPLSQQFGQYMQATGDPEPLNHLNRRLMEVAEIDDMDGLEMKPLPPPQPEGQQPPPPDPAAEAAAQAKQQDMQLQAARAQQKMQIDAETHQQRSQQAAETHAISTHVALAKARLDSIKAGAKPKSGGK